MKLLFLTCIIFILLLILLVCSCTFFIIITTLITSDNSNSDIILEEKITGIYGSSTPINTSKIAIVDVNGVINYSLDTEILPEWASNRTIIAQLNKAKNDEYVKAVLIRFNSPGGAVAAAEPICRAIKDVNKIKPVYAFIDTEWSSLSYLLSNCTKYIYARPESITWSIGVKVNLLDLNGILEKLGAKQITITNTSWIKKTQDGLFDKNSEEYKQLQSMLDEIYDYFLNKVWEGRKDKNNWLTFETLKSYADGRIFSGSQAKKAGLVDEIGYYEDIINSVIIKEKLVDEEVQIIEYKQ